MVLILQSYTGIFCSLLISIFCFQLYQEFPVSEELFLEDLEQDKEGGVYLHSCRCGGHYTLAAQDARSSTEKEVVVACDNCSLSILVLLNCDENT